MVESRIVDAGRGWQWIVDGFNRFRLNPLVWIAITILLALLWMVSLAIPLLGPLLFNLFSPALFAGLMLGCRAQDSGEALALGHLFAGFRKHASPLVTVGGVYLIGTIIVLGIVLVTAGGTMLPAALSKPGADLETVAAAIRSLALALAIGATAYLPLLMLIWFAPLLVVFDGLAPVDAMKCSFAACWKNVLPFLVYGVAVVVLWIVATIPLFLGLVVLLPVLICSVYASYKDLFVPRRAPAGGNPPLAR